MKVGNYSKYLILYLAYFVYSISAVCAKYAAKQTTVKGVVLFILLEIACLGVYALIYQQALKRFPLSVALSNKGITVILTLMWAVLLFHEQISGFNLLGSASIIAGICLVSLDE